MNIGTSFPRISSRLAGALLAALAVAPVQAYAQQAYPSKPIEIIVASSAGGILDTIARTAAHGLERLGQSAVAKNLPGGGGTIATAALARMPGDGYTLGAVATSHAINPNIYNKLAYDTGRDFTNITQMVELTNFLVVNPSVPASNLKEFIALAKAKPGTLTYGSAGVGQSNHLSGELLQQDAGIKLVHVPYRGSAQALTDVIGGSVSAMFVDALSAEPYVKAGKLKLIAATGLARSPAYPDYPTLAESGLPGFNGNTWLGLVAPAGVPKDIVAKLQDAVRAEFEDPDVRKRLISQGVIPVASTPQAFSAFLDSEMKRWAEVIKVAGIEAN
ncbi:tripartite tricarboxylate transporter substrate binding protein [Bordetella bronchiseptica]|uniref:tripartite tricarboxylate transporter substrate binding protein n=1 Tax=Bordetella bronchiseptica TaxID=518 RepID=UPI00028B096D|nr:tripartite tricarboxylate transporter substrate binding protein [Bordetella bronchiseptica]AUL17536.1 ABC transporter substrate-binding protein [Bordetella bronchiseptica]AWP60774.1 ABC transporter substrate-binding protein [Bordetella bronchiseptica]KAK50823.1 tripartite tricarboxylate transporter family receptor [Bordetella bronchiseptica OSU054]KAK76828.1 tripartite tricarboxylate transporter family receptor [Bordetella bronchiseptica CA90 BB02]KDB76220.1 tripartite tricarboxylate transp